MKAKIFFSILALLIFSIASASAEVSIQEFSESSNVGNIVGPLLNSEDISVQGAKITKSEDSSFGSTTRIDITKEDGSLKIKDSEFTNIQPAKEGQEAYFQLGENGEVKECDFYTNEKGGKYTIGNYDLQVPPNSRVTYKDGNIDVVPTENVELTEESMPKLKEQSNLQNGAGNVNYKALNGKTLTLPNGNVLQGGEIVFENGQAYITDNSRINNLDIDLAEGNKIKTFFDGGAHAEASGNYISLNADEKKMYVLSKNSLLDLKFDGGNPYIPMFEGQNFEIKSYNVINSNLEFGILNSQDKIPQLEIVKFQASAIQNSEYNIYPSNYQSTVLQIKKISEVNNGGTIPMTLKFNDEKLLPVNKILLINSDNSYGIINQANINFEKYTSLDYQSYSGHSETTKILEASLPGVKIINPQKMDIAKLQAMQEMADEMTPELKSYITQVKFEEKIDGAIAATGNSNYAGEINIASTTNEVRETFSHESAHTLDDHIKDSGEEIKRLTLQIDEEREKEIDNLINEKGYNNLEYLKSKISDDEIFEQAKKMLDSGEMTYKEIYTALPNTAPDFEDILQKYANKKVLLRQVKKDFDLLWLETQYGDKIDSYSEFYRAGDYVLGNKWKDGSAGTPKNGFVRPYGESNIQEDKATFVEQVYKDSSFFKPLVNPQSPKYDKRYVQKLELLKKYGFISQEKFNEIFRAAGLMN